MFSLKIFIQMVEVPFYPCNPYNQPSKESKPRPISLASFPSPPNSPGTFHTPPTSPSAAVSARKRQDLWQLIVFSEPYYNVIFIPGKWHQRPAMRKKKAAFFKRFNHQSSNSQPKLEVNLVAMVCLCSPEATCPSSLHLEGCLSPKPTSSSWPSSATPALYSQDRWFTFPIKFVKLPSCRWIVTTWSPPTCLLERSAMICHIRWIQPSSSFDTLDHLLQACSEEDARRDFSKRNTVYKKWIVIWKPVNE